MRRLLALIPALMLVFGLALPAQAFEQTKYSDCHLKGDPSTTGMTVTLRGYDSGINLPDGQRALLLSHVTVTNTCAGWGALNTFLNDANNEQPMFLVVAPGTTRTIGRLGLKKLGIWLHPYTNWGVRAPYWASSPCHSNWTNGGWILDWVLQGGKLSTSPPPECATGVSDLKEGA